MAEGAPFDGMMTDLQESLIEKMQERSGSKTEGLWQSGLANSLKTRTQETLGELFGCHLLNLSKWLM